MNDYGVPEPHDPHESLRERMREIYVEGVHREIADIRLAIEKLRIGDALTQLCQQHNLLPGPVIDGLADRCVFEAEQMVILDEFLCPCDFLEAIRTLGGGE